MFQGIELQGWSAARECKIQVAIWVLPVSFLLSPFTGTLLASDAHYLLRAVILCFYTNGFQVKLEAARSLLAKIAGRVTCKLPLDCLRNSFLFCQP